MGDFAGTVLAMECTYIGKQSEGIDVGNVCSKFTLIHCTFGGVWWGGSESLCHCAGEGRFEGTWNQFSRCRGESGHGCIMAEMESGVVLEGNGFKECSSMGKFAFAIERKRSGIKEGFVSLMNEISMCSPYGRGNTAAFIESSTKISETNSSHCIYGDIILRGDHISMCILCYNSGPSVLLFETESKITGTQMSFVSNGCSSGGCMIGVSSSPSLSLTSSVIEGNEFDLFLDSASIVVTFSDVYVSSNRFDGQSAVGNTIRIPVLYEDYESQSTANINGKVTKDYASLFILICFSIVVFIAIIAFIYIYAQDYKIKMKHKKAKEEKSEDKSQSDIQRQKLTEEFFEMKYWENDEGKEEEVLFAEFIKKKDNPAAYDDCKKYDKSKIYENSDTSTSWEYDDD